MKILIVEDDRVSAIPLRRMLEQFGHAVTIAENGIEAWQRLKTERFTLVITAWFLPELSGVEIARRIRRKGDTETYILLLSSRDPAENRNQAVAAGADDFLARPLDREELLSRLNIAERVLKLQRERDSLAAALSHSKMEMERITQIDEKNLAEIRVTCQDLERAQVQLQARSITDSLTGLKNHREFHERLEDEVNRASRHNLPLSLLLMDVDHFKSYNDTYGHPAGDEALRRVAKILERHARETDILARYGGEEFAVILVNTDREDAIIAAERFRQAIACEDWPNHGVKVSVGVSTLRILPQSRSDLVLEADTALYACKRHGRNRVAHFNDHQDAV